MFGKKYTALREGLTEVIAIPTYLACGYLAGKGADLVKDVEKAILENRDAKAVLVNNPTYYGICSNLKAITGNKDIIKGNKDIQTEAQQIEKELERLINRIENLKCKLGKKEEVAQQKVK